MFARVGIFKCASVACLSQSELAAFISYAQAFPNMFLALVDTYDTLNSGKGRNKTHHVFCSFSLLSVLFSLPFQLFKLPPTGVPNFITVASVLADLGYKPMGIRLDSGDLAYLSRETRKMFRAAGEQLGPSAAYMEKLAIVASNDINEDVLISLNREGHEIDTFGIGTQLGESSFCLGVLKACSVPYSSLYRCAVFNRPQSFIQLRSPFHVYRTILRRFVPLYLTSS